MFFILKIELGNDMMSSSLHVADALRKVADRLNRVDYPLDMPMTKGVKDANGNTVGSWEITETDGEP